MAEPQVTPYGSWASPITGDLIVADSITLGQIELDGDDVYWIEGRPTEGGRQVVVRRAADGVLADVTPAGFNARTRVHEYGGGSFKVHDGTVYFSNWDDQRLYRQDSGAEPVPITPPVALRYADATIDAGRGRLICVREDHTVEGREAVNTLVSLNLDGAGNEDGGQLLVAGNDFYSTPRLSPDGKMLAWLTWNHPNMPWDGTEMWLATVADDGTLADARKIAGGPQESIYQPEWSPDGVLYFVSDRTNWWNLYRWRDGQTEFIYPAETEFGMPQWQLASSAYGFTSESEIVCRMAHEGIAHLMRFNLATGNIESLRPDYTVISYVKTAPGRAAYIAASPTDAPVVELYDFEAHQATVLRRSSDVEVDPGYISIPQSISFPTENGLTAYGFYYPPVNRDYVAPKNEKSPLIVMCHGGPTGATYAMLDLSDQYWTSRGFGVLDVNYGGSTGYGREYRTRLNGNWGIVDMDDCVNGARYLAEQGLVDPDRMVIRGGSAGGYTTLNALTFRNAFKAGASYYGISDLETFVHDTHKFESRYLFSLVGPYPEEKQKYHDRSAIHFTDRLSAPMILFQGLEDRIVPPSQSELMVEALRKKGLPVAYIAFEGEQHGFRRAENIKRSMEAELYFYSRIFDFQPADQVEPVEIENLV